MGMASGSANVKAGRSRRTGDIGSTSCQRTNRFHQRLGKCDEPRRAGPKSSSDGDQEKQQQPLGFSVSLEVKAVMVCS
jgi:hypothetical protein